MNPELMATNVGTRRAEHIGTAVLLRLAEIDAHSLSPETARSFLELAFESEQQRRVNTLSEKARRGSITAEESAELDEYIHVGNLLAILQSKARQALKHAGLSS